MAALGGLLLLGLLAALLGVGAPVAVALGLSALVAVAVGTGDLSDVSGLVNVLFWTPFKSTLLPVPLFIVVGMVLAESALVRHMIALADRLVGRLPGGLGIVAVVVGIFFAGISGSGPADVAALGTILIPSLVKAGWPRPRAAALLAASGGLGIVVPPSIALILYAFVAQGSVLAYAVANPDAPVPAAPSIERLFLAGIVPGLLLGVALSALLMFMARGEKRARTQSLSGDEATGVLVLRALPGLFVPVLILGGIYLGWFTATQAAAVATVYALVLEIFIYREMHWRAAGRALARAGVTTGQVMILVACAAMFATVLVRLRLDEPAIAALAALPASRLVFLLVLNVVVLALGCVIDAISILFIVVPIALPVALDLGIDPVHLGVVLIVNLAIGQITPPVGVNLFVAASVAGERLGPICRAVVPFVLVELIVLALVSAIPAVCLVW